MTEKTHMCQQGIGLLIFLTHPLVTTVGLMSVGHDDQRSIYMHPNLFLQHPVESPAIDDRNDAGQQVSENLQWPSIPLPLQRAPTERELLAAEKVGSDGLPCKQQLGFDPAWQWNLPRLSATQEAVGNAHVDVESACTHLQSGINDQFESLVPVDSDAVWAWTVVDQAYGKWIADWILQIRGVGAEKIIVVSIDPEPQWAMSLCRQGIPVLDFTEQGRVNATVAEAKFLMPRRFIRRHLTNMFAEMDIFWQRSSSLRLDEILQQTSDSHLVLASTGASGKQEIKIGFWICKRDAPQSVAILFEEALALKGWDQVAFNEVAPKVTDLKIYGSTAYPHSQSRHCDYSENQCKLLSQVRIGLLSSIVHNGYLGVSTFHKFQEKFSSGMHVWSYDGALKGASGKVIVAQNAGLFFGAGCYYEQCDSGEQYVAWDGVLHEGSDAKTAMEIILASAWASNRSIIMPQVKSKGGSIGFSEMLFSLDYPKVRESNFLYNPRLSSDSLYPVVQLTVNEKGWAAVKKVPRLGQPSTSFFRDEANKGSGAIGRLLSVLLQCTEVTSAKTLLISMDSFGQGTYLPSLNVASCGGGIPEVVRRVRYCRHKAIKEEMTASDVC